MSRVFADTSFYVAAVNEHDVLHSSVRQFSDNFAGEIVTTEYVLVELGNWLSKSRNKKRFGVLLDVIDGDPDTQVIPAGRELLSDGARLFVQHEDKQWSLTDCISFVVMRRLGISEALTSDHHFLQAGFKSLLVT